VTAKSSHSLDPRTVKIPNPDKVMFPGEGITKRDLADYYERIAPVMLPHLRDRPLHLQRFPDGIEEEEVHQKQVPQHFPDWVHRVRVPRKQGGSIEQVLCQDAATLVYLVGQACLTPHAWLSRSDGLDNPDLMIFDLDPPAGDLKPAVAAARELRDLLGDLGLTAFVKATGGRGLHVAVPLDRRSRFDATRTFAREVATMLAERRPDDFTVEQRKEKRGGRLFLDTMRNAYAQTAVAPYAVRARPGAPAAVPLEWEELGQRGFRPDGYPSRSVFDLLEKRPDPWAQIGRRAGSLERASRELQRLREAPGRPR
jgi:bifunctional non-homologous end joining protein LigD